MTNSFFALGGVFLLVGLVALFFEQRILGRIMRETNHLPGALTSTETWLNTRQFSKWRKLRVLSEKADKLKLREDAKNALRFQVAFYVLVLTGMLLMLASASGTR